MLHLSDAVRSFGSFDSEDEARDFHRGAQELLSSWCCTADERFKRIAGVVPYLLPPLPGQAAWRGDPNLAWAAEALGAAYAETNQSGMAVELDCEPRQRLRRGRRRSGGELMFTVPYMRAPLAANPAPSDT